MVFFPWSIHNNLWHPTIYHSSSGLLDSWPPRHNCRTQRMDRVDWRSASTNTRTIREHIRFKSNLWTKTLTTKFNLSTINRTKLTRLKLTSKLSWTWSNSRCTFRRIRSTVSIRRTVRKPLQMDKLLKSSWLKIRWIVKITKSVRILPTTKLINRDESYYLNMDLRRIFQMPTLLMARDNLLTMANQAFPDTTRSKMVLMEPIWRTCQVRRRFKRRGMVLKIAISEVLLKGQASATTNSKLKAVLTVRHTKELQRVHQIIQATQAFFR